MAKIDRLKELIGYLKVIFGILVAIDISIIGWLFKNGDEIASTSIVLAVVAIVCTTFGIVIVNRKILQTIDALEDL
jgi:4-hydroxybenzoate polyprenyltransferase